MAYRKGRKTRKGRCVRYKRVRVRGQGYARRCAKYASRSSSRGSRRRAGGYRKGHRPANKGKRCTAWKRVRMRGGKVVRRCAKYNGGETYSNKIRRMVVEGDVNAYYNIGGRRPDTSSRVNLNPSWMAL